MGRYSRNGNNDEESFEVQAILDRKQNDKGVFYKVKWKGYSEAEASWQPSSNLDHCQQLVLIFDLSHLPSKDKEAIMREVQLEQEKVDLFKCGISGMDAMQYNLQVLGQEGLQQRAKEIREWVKNGADLVPGNIVKVVQMEKDSNGRPCMYRVVLDDGTYLRNVEIPRKYMLQHHRKDLINYYESLLVFNQQ